MNDHIEIYPVSGNEGKAKKKYQAPSLQAFGKIADLTQSGSSVSHDDGEPNCNVSPEMGSKGRMC